MDFLKRVAEGLTHSEERSAVKHNGDYLTKDEVVVCAPAATTTTHTSTATVTTQPSVVASTPDSVTAITGTAEITTLKATTVDTVARAPVIDETIIREREEIIQPVIHREIERTEVRHVIQPVYQEETIPTQVEERVLAAEYRGEVRAGPDVLEQLQLSGAQSQPSVITTATAERTTTVVNEAIVHEIIKPHIIEEVQPVIHRTIHQPQVIHERKDIYEKIVEAPVEVIETRAPIFEKEVFIAGAVPTRAEYREAL